MLKECPSCAMEIDAKCKVCPICDYEFSDYSPGMKWAAVILIVLILVYFLFQLF